MAHFYQSIPRTYRDLAATAAIDQFEQGGTLLTSAIEGLTDAQLDSYPVPGTWSVRQIVIHLLDTDQIAAYRMKRIIAEDVPRLDVYNENAFVEALHYDKQDAQRAGRLFAQLRNVTADILRRQPETCFDRAGLHPEIGEMKLGELLRIYVFHLEHHLGFIERKKRIILGDTD